MFIILLEKQLVALIGDTGYKLHSGRSRNGEIATDLRLYVRASIDELQRLLAEWVAVFLSRAEKAGDAAMPAYTHTQRAEPVLMRRTGCWHTWKCFSDSEQLTTAGFA